MIAVIRLAAAAVRHVNQIDPAWVLNISAARKSGGSAPVGRN